MLLLNLNFKFSYGGGEVMQKEVSFSLYVHKAIRIEKVSWAMLDQTRTFPLSYWSLDHGINCKEIAHTEGEVATKVTNIGGTSFCYLSWWFDFVPYGVLPLL